ncbi:MAG: NUDIX domain-containing protein [Anaerolineales bacterium]|nr:NUDIX domain-containing protein [Anaerolineales bacterium]
MNEKKQRIETRKYTVIPRTLCFLFSENKVLLIRYSGLKGTWAGKYNGIGGHVDQGESIFRSALREIEEETGLVPDSLQLCGTVMINTASSPGIALYIFAGGLRMIASEALLVSPEGEASWISIEDLKSLPLMEDTPMLIEKSIAVLAGKSPPFAALYQYTDEGKLDIQMDTPDLVEKSS